MSDSGGGDSYVGGELTARSARPQQQCFEVVEEAKGQWMRVLQQLEFDGVEWRAWTEFRQWERDEEGREIEDEGEFRQALCEKYRMSKEKLNCILTLGVRVAIHQCPVCCVLCVVCCVLCVVCCVLCVVLCCVLCVVCCVLCVVCLYACVCLVACVCKWLCEGVHVCVCLCCCLLLWCMGFLELELVHVLVFRV